MFVYSADREAQDYEAITVSNAGAGIGITASKFRHSQYGPCVVAFITVETANIRFRLDGTAPTTTEGHKLTNGQNLTLACESDIRNFLAIRDDAVDATLRVTLRY